MIIITIISLILIAVIVYIIYIIINNRTKKSTPSTKSAPLSNKNFNQKSKFQELLQQPGILQSMINKTDINEKDIIDFKQHSIKLRDQVKVSKRNNRSPVVVIPGVGGTQLKISNTDWSKFPECSSYQREDGTIWVGLNPIVGKKCNFSITKNVFNNDTKEYSSNKNTNITVVGEPGSIASCGCLNYSFKCLFGKAEYFKDLFDLLINVGYKDMIDLFACGYDFRLVPFGNLDNYDTFNDSNNYIGNFFMYLKNTVEKAYKLNNKKVILLGHSMGCCLSNMFLNKIRELSNKGIVEINWVDKYIDKYIVIAPAFDGAPTNVRSLLSGESSLPIGEILDFRDAYRTFAGNTVLVPLLKIGYNNNKIIEIIGKNGKSKKIVTTSDNYDKDNSIINYFLQTEKLNIFGEMLKNISKMKLYAIQDPNLPVYLIYGNSVDTEYGNYIYFEEPDDFNKDPITGSISKGDGTVPVSLLRIPFLETTIKVEGKDVKLSKWKNLTEHIITDINNGEHTKIISDKSVHNYILNIIAPN